MLRNELNRYIHDRRTRIFVSLIILIPIFDFFQVFISQYRSDFSDLKYRLSPSVASFLSGSLAEHYGQVVFVWFMPILLLGLCADRAVKDHKDHYDVIQIMRWGKKRFYVNNLLINGALSFVATSLGLVINYLLSLLVFHGGRNFLSDDLENPNLMSAELSWQYHHTILIMIITIAITVMLVTIFAMACYALSVVCLNYYVVYTIAFTVWFAQIISKYSITYLMQPFIEYGLKYQVPSIVIFLLISFMIIFFGYWSVTRHADWL